MMEYVWMLVGANIIVWGTVAVLVIRDWRKGKQDRDQHYH